MKNTKAKLISSVAVLLTCFAMLIGSTFAWFTDSASTGVNKIQAGNLDIEVFHSNKTVTNEAVADTTTLFTDVIKWEPGAVAYENITIKNVGNLSAKIKLNLKDVVKNSTNDGHDLTEVIKIAVVDGGFSNPDRDSILESSFDSFSVVEEDFKLDATDNTEKTYGIALYWQPTDHDNDYNVSIPSEELYIQFGLEVLATQCTVENDSFDELYDEDAPYARVSTTEELEDAIANPNVRFIEIEGNETVLNIGASHTDRDLDGITIKGKDSDATLIIEGQKPGNRISNFTLNNITIFDKTTSYNNNAWELGYLTFEDVVMNNVKFTGNSDDTSHGEIMLDGTNVMTGCIFNSQQRDSYNFYSVWVNSGDSTFLDCSFNGIRGLKIHEAYGSEVDNVLVKKCEFNNLTQKPGINIGNVNSKTKVAIYETSFNNCRIDSENYYYLSAWQSDTDTTTFNFVFADNNNIN